MNMCVAKHLLHRNPLCRRDHLALILIHYLMIDSRDLTEMLGGLEHVTRFVEVPTHADRAIVAVGTHHALREVLSSHRTDVFCL